MTPFAGRASSLFLASAVLTAGLTVCTSALAAQATPDSGTVTRPDSQPKAPEPKPWWQRVTIGGFLQLRYNQLLQTNELLVCQACDPNLGGVPRFSFREARVFIRAAPVDRIAVVVEVDLTQVVGTSQLILQLRELYGDLFLDKKKEAILRLGFARVPYGYENLQSSAVRLPFDRDDAIASGAPGERDVGAWAIWAPESIHQEFRMLVDSLFKGAADYGIVSVGLYNGQSSNRPELNGNKHVVARVAYPFRLPHNQVMVGAVQAYTGIYVVQEVDRTPGVGGGSDFRDKRLGLSGILMPRPFGLQAEWNWGTGPEYDNVTNAITEQDLNGGYVMAYYRTFIWKRLFYPYVRYQYYNGGKKNELDARSYLVKEWEIGAEILPVKAFEFTAAYMISNRTQDDGLHPNNPQKGQTLRLQAQFNY